MSPFSAEVAHRVMHPKFVPFELSLEEVPKQVLSKNIFSPRLTNTIMPIVPHTGPP